MSELLPLAVVFAALLVAWSRRCRQLPQYMPGDVRPTLREAPRRAPAPAPAPTPKASPPAPEMEFAPAQATATTEDIVFEPAPSEAVAPAPEPEPEPEIDPAALESRLLEIQGEFEERAALLAARLEREWEAMREFLKSAPAAEPGAPAIELREIEAPPQKASADPVPPPDEIDPSGWSEPAENGVRSRGLEFLGPLADPGQPPSPTNARPYYRERRVEEDGLVFREITRGIVVGRQLRIQECARYPENGLGTLLEVHRRRAAEGGAPAAYRLWVTRERAIRVFGTRSEVRRLEPLLLELPEPVRARLPDILLAPDLGGRVDWEGSYFQDEQGQPATHAVLADAEMLALRHALEPTAARAALAFGLGEHLEEGAGETHRALLEQWDDPISEAARALKRRLYP